MSVKYTSTFLAIAAKKPTELSLALRFAAEDVVRTAAPKTPKDKGPLSESTQREVLGTTATITWPQNYAAAQEAGVTRGHKMVNYTTPGTGPNFAFNAVNEVNDRFEKHLRAAKAIE